MQITVSWFLIYMEEMIKNSNSIASIEVRNDTFENKWHIHDNCSAFFGKMDIFFSIAG